MKHPILLTIALSAAITFPACGATKQPVIPRESEQATESVFEAETEGESETDTDAVGVLGRFATTDLEGNAIDQSVLAGYDLNMINLWATYCGPCLNEMPDLGELAEEYADKHVQIIGIVLDVMNADGSLSESQIETAREIVDKTKAGYTHLVPSMELLPLLYQFPSVPATFFVDGDGNLVGDLYLGAQSKDDWKTILDKTLSEVTA